MKHLLGSYGLALALLAASGCSLASTGTATSGAGGGAGAQEIAALKAHIVELQRRAAVSEVELRRLEKRLADLEGAVARSREAVATEAPVARNDRAPRGPDGPGPVDSGTPAGDIGSGLEVSDLPPGEAVSGADDNSSPSAALTVAAQALYDRGYTLYHQERYVDSETAFQQFLQRHSDTVLGDNAQYWIAEARFARGDVNGALAAYRETAIRFPGGNKVPDAHLKIGDCLRDLGDTEAARRSYRTVLREFPSSAAAVTAQERLAESP